jgi:hypothetical protein
LARWQLPHADAAASLQALFPRSFDRLLMDGSPRGLPVDCCATMMLTTSAPW